MSSEQQQVEINLTKLSLQQLDQLKNQLNQEVQLLQESMSQLKMAQQSFVNSDTSLQRLRQMQQSDATAANEILVPLTGSLYVPGRLVANNTVLVDIGTGYFVQKSLTDAAKHFEKKITFLTKQMETLQPIMQQKAMIREDVVEVFQKKLQIQMAVQKQMSATAAAAPATQKA